MGGGLASSPGPFTQRALRAYNGLDTRCDAKFFVCVFFVPLITPLYRKILLQLYSLFSIVELDPTPDRYTDQTTRAMSRTKQLTLFRKKCKGE